ncbi:MAG: ABC transporter ATP-binding protein [Corynebacterium sp.]|nr:ABC transporter ATP-binding protein [Corynebacterium sp.]
MIGIPLSNNIALRLDGVVKKFGEKTAVNGISFEVPRASILALLGPNGAGKTTTIEMCEGFQKPTAGTIDVLGMNPTEEPDKVRRHIGVMLQGGGAYPGIRVGEMIKLIASYSDNPLDPDWLLEVVGLEKHKKTSYRRLSGGQQQRLSLACALIGRPELIFLDEPTAGMDAQSRLAVWDLIQAFKKDGMSVVLTTHLMDEAEALADDVVIIDHGSVVAHGSPDSLMNSSSKFIKLTTATPLDLSSFNQDLQHTYPNLRLEAIRPLSYRIESEADPQIIESISHAAATQDVLITDLTVDHRSLEEVFLSITGREMRS